MGKDGKITPYNISEDSVYKYHSLVAIEMQWLLTA
jgi:hypothetical protein